MRPPAPFGLTLQGTPLHKLDLPGDHMKIEMAVAFEGNVPLYEEHCARVEAGYTLKAWSDMPSSLKAFEVAHYRYRNAVAAFANEHAQKSAQRKPKRR